MTASTLFFNARRSYFLRSLSQATPNYWHVSVHVSVTGPHGWYVVESSLATPTGPYVTYSLAGLLRI